MISLKPYLEQNPERVLRLSADAYRASVCAFVDSGMKICPFTGKMLEKNLSAAADLLKKTPTAATLQSAQEKVLKSLRAWGEQSENYFKRKTAEVKEILTEMAGAAESFCRRDQRYAQQFYRISADLNAIAQLDDLGRMRSSLLRNANELKECVEQMAREGSNSLNHLKASLASYQIQLEEAQELASLDPLTGLFNRREVESRIGLKLAQQSSFCIVIIDLDNFKQINDRHGHLAGDELLRQVAAELRQASRADDIIGRWGGDEFILLMDGNLANAKIKVQRMRPWVFGNYELEIADYSLNVAITGSIGMAEWRPGETMLQVIRRADSAMYHEKAASR